MDKETSKAPVPQIDDNSGDYERGLKVLGRIIARRHMRIQLTKSKGYTDENIIERDNNSNTSKA
jgi:hypothetical protein